MKNCQDCKKEVDETKEKHGEIKDGILCMPCVELRNNPPAEAPKAEGEKPIEAAKVEAPPVAENPKKRRDIWTLDAVDKESGEGQDYRETMVTYYNENEAVAAAMKLQQENADLEVGIVYGEYETDSGTFGEPTTLSLIDLGMWPPKGQGKANPPTEQSVPAGFKRIKRINSHTGHARYLAEEAVEDIGEIPRTNIPSPYAYSPTHLVSRTTDGKRVIIVETAHKQYDVYEIPADMPLMPIDTNPPAEPDSVADSPPSEPSDDEISKEFFEELDVIENPPNPLKTIVREAKKAGKKISVKKIGNAMYGVFVEGKRVLTGAVRSVKSAMNPAEMTARRASEILEMAKERTRTGVAYGPWADQLKHVMTAEEREQVIQVWDTLPGYTSFVDALEYIAGDKKKQFPERHNPPEKENPGSYYYPEVVDVLNDRTVQRLRGSENRAEVITRAKSLAKRWKLPQYLAQVVEQREGKEDRIAWDARDKKNPPEKENPAGHTPGPWAQQGRNVHSLQFDEPLDNRNLVASVPNVNPESIANACLIAEAPDLLKVLRDEAVMMNILGGDIHRFLEENAPAGSTGLKNTVRANLLGWATEVREREMAARTAVTKAEDTVLKWPEATNPSPYAQIQRKMMLDAGITPPPDPKFRIGDKVKRDDGSDEGVISFIGGYDDYLKQYRYKVQSDRSGRKFWNENSIVLVERANPSEAENPASGAFARRVADTEKTPLWPKFVEWVRQVAAANNMTEDEIWAKWQEFERQSWDQSALTSDFLAWRHLKGLDIDGREVSGNPPEKANPTVDTYRMTFGTCRRCHKEPAHFMPLGLCDKCHSEFARLGGGPGSEDRRKRVEAFFEGSGYSPYADEFKYTPSTEGNPASDFVQKPRDFVRSVFWNIWGLQIDSNDDVYLTMYHEAVFDEHVPGIFEKTKGAGMRFEVDSKNYDSLINVIIPSGEAYVIRIPGRKTGEKSTGSWGKPVKGLPAIFGTVTSPLSTMDTRTLKTVDNPSDAPAFDYNYLTLTDLDHKVVKAFTEKKALDSKHLETDGKTLDGNWMGGRGIAEWKGDQIHFNDLGSRAAQTVQHAIRREAAPADLEGYVKPHHLIITSLDDCSARCSAGDWSMCRTGRTTKEEIEKEFKKHTSKKN